MDKYKKEIEQLLVRIESMKEAATTEKRELTIEETDTVNEMLDRVDQVEALVKLEERTNATKTRITASKVKPIKPTPDGKIDLLNNESDFRSLGEFACAVRDASVPGGRVDPRLFETRTAGDPTSSVASPSDGGFLITKNHLPDFMKITGADASLITRVKKVGMGGEMFVSYNFFDGFDLSGGTVHGGIAWANAAEMGGYTATKPEYGEFEIKLKELYGFSYQSNKLLKFAPGVVEAQLRSGFDDGFRQKTDYELINGTGAAGPQGLLNSPAKIEVTANGGASTFLWEDAVDMYARLYDKNDFVVLASPDVIPQLFTMNQAVGTGGNMVYMPAGGASAKPYDTLFGRQIIWTDACASLGTIGDVIFLNPSHYHLGMDGDGVSGDISVHLKFDYNQTAFRFIVYWDGGCWWKSAMTPRNGGSTRSPIVVLATRT